METRGRLSSDPESPLPGPRTPRLQDHEKDSDVPKPPSDRLCITAARAVETAGTLTLSCERSKKIREDSKQV